MSTKAERAALTKMALTEWGVVLEILTERGEVWPYTNPSQWGPGLTGAMERVKALTEACAVIGADDARDTDHLADLYDRTHGRH